MYDKKLNNSKKIDNMCTFEYKKVCSILILHIKKILIQLYKDLKLLCESLKRGERIFLKL